MENDPTAKYVNAALDFQALETMCDTYIEAQKVDCLGRNFMMIINYEAVIQTVHNTRSLIMNKERRSQVTQKGIGDFVTQVDLSVQTYLQAVLGDEYPQIQFMGEEDNERNLDESKPAWILDPIDGTSNLIFNLEHSAVSLALYDGEQIVFGVIYNPYKEETFHAIRGQGSFLNGEPIHVNAEQNLADCLIAFGTNPYARIDKQKYFHYLCDLQLRCVDLRRFGSAALDLAYVACGRYGGFIEPYLKPWDIAAGRLLIEEAGGVTSTPTGGKINPLYPSDVLAGAPKVYGEMYDMTKQYNCF